MIFERLYFFYATKLIAKGYNQDLQDSIDASGMEGIQKFLAQNKDQRITDVLVNGMDVSQNDPEIFSQGVEREAAEKFCFRKGQEVGGEISFVQCSQ